MAITAQKSPYVLTAQGDDLATVFQGRDMLDTTPVCRFKCASIYVNFGASGPCTLLDKPGGQIIFRSSGDPGETAEAHFDALWFDGCYVQDLPADSEVLLYVV